MGTVSSIGPTFVDARLGKAAGYSSHLTPLERSVVFAVVYADVFDFPLTHDELFTGVVTSSVDRASLERCVRRLTGDLLRDTGEYISLPGREHLADLRAARSSRAEHVWISARRFARWFRYVPFLRSVSVSGSLAVGNVSGTGDVDLFCITATNRLWISRLFLVPLSKVTRFLPKVFGHYLCPNYLIDQASLAIEDRNLFTAHEVTQAVPLWGFRAHRQFLHANGWTTSLLPNTATSSASRSVDDQQSSPPAIRLFERLLGGRLGDFINSTVYALFVGAYRLRARRRGWSWQKLLPAYQIGRYTVPEGGYTEVVADIFRQRVHEVAGRRISKNEIDALFPPRESSESVYPWRSLFAEEYGSKA